MNSEITTVQTVHDLRHRWKPHKERFLAAGGEQATSIRFHRALQLDGPRRTDIRAGRTRVWSERHVSDKAEFGGDPLGRRGQDGRSSRRRESEGTFNAKGQVMPSKRLFWTSVIAVGIVVPSRASDAAGLDYLKVKDLTPVKVLSTPQHRPGGIGERRTAQGQGLRRCG